MRISIVTIPHEHQRYPTVGDWFSRWPDYVLQVRVSETGDSRYNALVAVHELIEALLCEARGISEESVTAFDVAHPEMDDPGGDPAAPYHREHTFATQIEMLLAEELGVDWDEYEAALITLGAPTPALHEAMSPYAEYPRVCRKCGKPEDQWGSQLRPIPCEGAAPKGGE